MPPLSPELDADPGLSPSPSQPESPTPETWEESHPLFQEGTPPDTSSLPHPSSETPTEHPSSDAGAGSVSPPPSTSRRNRKRELLDVAKALVETVTGFAHEFLTAEGSLERQAGLYLADGDDVKAISDPLAGLGSRRMPEGAENPDVADMVRLALGTAVYVAKQVRTRTAIRRMYADPSSSWYAGTPEDAEEAATEADG